jgi:hypothetical protein
MNAAIVVSLILTLVRTETKEDSDLMSAPEEAEFLEQAERERKEELNLAEGLNPQPDHSGNLDDQSSNPPTTLIYVCEGSSKPLAYCQFPFTTLAGNEYTSSCADKVEDNPDYSVDRPWCFTSATEWGFCDCEAFFDFSYVTSHNAADSSIRDLTIQVKLSYPGKVWCDLGSDESYVPLPSSLPVDSVVEVTRGMILENINGQVEIHATLDRMKSHPYLSCHAAVPGLRTNPKPMITKLGTKKEVLEDPDDDDSPEEKPRLITHTSGALMYSTLIFMTLASFFFYRYAMDRRARLFSFIRLVDGEAAK